MLEHQDFDLAQMMVAMQQVMEHAPKYACITPGRVNLIGEHTDYNGGFVLPMAIRWVTGVFAAPRGDNIVKVYSKTLDKHAEFSLDSLVRQPDMPWADYVIGVIWALQEAGHPVQGADLFLDSMIPMGAGLSSSAALEMAVLGVFEAMGGFKLEDMQAAKLGQKVENDFLGLKSGIMDQAIVRGAREQHAMLLDCRSLEQSFHPFNFENTVLLVAHTGLDRALTTSKYNERVEECQHAVGIMKDHLKKRDAVSLRDFTLADLDACSDMLEDTLSHRARHVISENDRVLKAVQAMNAGDSDSFGQLMNESHTSLKEDYEVTGNALDTLCDIARTLPGCIGSRMTGAGFGGCAIHLIEFPHWDAFQLALKEKYETATRLECTFCLTHAAAGPQTYGPFD